MPVVTINVGVALPDGTLAGYGQSVAFQQIDVSEQVAGPLKTLVVNEPVVVDLVTGSATVTLAAGFWLVDERWSSGRKFAVQVTTDVNYADLAVLSPRSLAPTSAPTPAWVVALAALQAQVNGIAGLGHEYLEPTPLSQWTITHNLGRRPTVLVYDTSGNEVIADVSSTSTTTTITFANAMAGSAVLI